LRRTAREAHAAEHGRAAAAGGRDGKGGGGRERLQLPFRQCSRRCARPPALCVCGKQALLLLSSAEREELWASCPSNPPRAFACARPPLSSSGTNIERRAARSPTPPRRRPRDGCPNTDQASMEASTLLYHEKQARREADASVVWEQLPAMRTPRGEAASGPRACAPSRRRRRRRARRPARSLDLPRAARRDVAPPALRRKALHGCMRRRRRARAERSRSRAPRRRRRTQVAALCGVHCLNTLLQGPIFTEIDLAQIGLQARRTTRGEEGRVLANAPAAARSARGRSP